jgi:hypothetical protein
MAAISTLKSILNGLALNILVVQRNRKGKIICAHFRTAQAGNLLRMSEGSHPLRTSAHLGTRYSFERSRRTR